MASPQKSDRLISSRGHGCFTISPPQLPATATRFPSHGSGRPGLVLQTATKLSSVGFEPTAVLIFGLRVRRLNHSATRSQCCGEICEQRSSFLLPVRRNYQLFKLRSSQNNQNSNLVIVLSKSCSFVSAT